MFYHEEIEEKTQIEKSGRGKDKYRYLVNRTQKILTTVRIKVIVKILPSDVQIKESKDPKCKPTFQAICK